MSEFSYLRYQDHLPLDWKSGFNWLLLALFSLSAGLSAGISILVFNILMPEIFVLLEADSFWVPTIGMAVSFWFAIILLALANKSFTLILQRNPGARGPNAWSDREPTNDGDVIKTLEALLSRMKRRKPWSIEGISYILLTTFLTFLIMKYSTEWLGLEPIKSFGVMIAAVFPILTVDFLHELFEDFGHLR